MIPLYRTALLFSGVLIFGLLQACGRPAVYRSSRPRMSPLPRKVTPSPSAAAASPKALAQPKPILAESKIREEDLGEGQVTRPTPMTPPPPTFAPSGPSLPQPGRVQSSAKAILEESRIRERDLGENRWTLPEPMREERASPGLSEETIFTRREELLLISMITPETPPQRAASLRLTEKGRKLLEIQEYERGLSKLEKAIAIDSRNRYTYYYLAQAHYLLTHYQQSLNFLEIVESIFAEESDWLARVFALQGKNYAAQGFFERADDNYAKALKLDPNNRVALKGITEM